jgi:hypothetical protein
MRKTLVTSLLSTSLLFVPAIASAGEQASCTQGQQHTLLSDIVVKNHLQALGGVERLKKVKTFQFTSAMQEGDKVSTSTVYRARPNLLRIDFSKDGKAGSKGYDGATAWYREGDAAAQPVPADKGAMLARKAQFDDALLDPQASGTQVTLAGVEDVKGAPAYKLVLTRGAGEVETRYIDQKSFLEVRRDYAGQHEGKAVTKSVYFSDYRKVDGVMVNHVTEWEHQGVKGRSTVTSARYDAPVDAAVFTMATPRS